MTKMTKRDYFNQSLSNYPLTADEKDFINHELELLERKNAKATDKAPSEKQKQNSALKAQILDFMESGKMYTVTEIQKALNIESNQRASALIRQLKDECLVIRTVEKGKAYFTKA